MDGYGQAWELVRRTRGRIRRLRAQADALWWALLPPLVLWAGVLAEHLGSHESAARLALRRGLLGALALWSLGLLLLLAWRLLWRRAQPDERGTALLLGQGDEEVRDRLLNGLEVIAAGRENRRAFDPGLIAASLDQVLPRLRQVDLRRVLPLAPRRRALAWCAAAWGLAAALFLLGGADARLAARRLLEPERDFRGAPLFSLILAADWPDPAHPGRLIEGQTLDLRVEARGLALPSEVVLEAAASEAGSAAGAPATWRLPLRLGRAGLAGLAPRGSLRLRASALESQLGQTRRVLSAPLDLLWLRPPRLDSLVLTVAPPRYTGLPARRLPDGTADLSCPQGSRVTVQAYTRDSLAAAWLESLPAADSLARPGAGPALALRPGLAQLALSATASRRWAVKVRDRHGLENPQPLVQDLTVRADQPPRLRVLAPREPEGSLGRELGLDLALLAEDDYGFGPCRLAWRVYSAQLRQLAPPPDPATLDSIPRDWKRRELPLHALAAEPLLVAEEAAPARRAAVEERWDLSDLDLLPDDELVFFFELWDNDGWRGPKATRSGLFRCKVPGLEELFAQVNDEEKQVEKEAEVLLQQAQENRQRLEELRQEQRRDNKMTWERQQKLKQVVREQERIAQKAGELAQRLEAAQQKMDANQLISEELRHKLEQLKNLLQEVMSPELLEKLRKAAEQAMMQPPPAGQPPRPQMDMDEVLRQMEEQLDRFLAVLEQMRLEQRLEELAKRSEALLERQRQLRQELKQGADPAQKSTEEGARRREAESLREDVEKLKDEFGQRSEFPRQELDEARRQLGEKQIPPRLGQMQEQMSQGQPPSDEAQEQMDQDLNELADALQRALQKSKQQAMAELSREIDRICQELLVISLRQEEIGGSLTGLNSRSPLVQGLAEQTLENQLGVKATTRGVYELTRKSLHIPTAALGELGAADQDLEQMLAGFHERQLGRMGSLSPDAMGRVNSALLLLKEADRNMQQSGQASGFEQMMEKMAEAASRQQCLNGQCNKLMGVKPGASQKPMSISFGEAGKEQGSIRESLESLHEKLGPEGQPRLGDLGQTAADMKEVEKDLAQQTYTERTQKLQERIASRLLDAQRSVRRQDEEKKRESRSAQPLRAQRPAPVELQKERALERDLLRALQGGYRPDMQDLIRDYFRALETGGEEGTDRR